MIANQPFNQYGFVKIDGSDDSILDILLTQQENRSCPILIGESGYIPYIAVKTDSFFTPLIYLITENKTDIKAVTGYGDGFVNFQTKDGVYWILNGGIASAASDPSGIFRFVIYTKTKEGKAVFYVSKWAKYDTSCVVEIQANHCSDVFPYLFRSGISESNFTIETDVRFWYKAGVINSTYESNVEVAERSNDSDKVTHTKLVKKDNLVIDTIAGCSADMINALQSFGDITVRLDGVSNVIKYPSVVTNQEDSQHCGSATISWESSVMTSTSCCDKQESRIGLDIKIIVEGIITSYTNHSYIDADNNTKTLQAGQYAYLHDGSSLHHQLVLKYPDGSIKLVDNLEDGDLVTRRNLPYSETDTLGFVKGEPPYLAFSQGSILQQRIVSLVYLQLWNPKGVELQVENATTGYIYGHYSSIQLTLGTLAIEAVQGDEIWIKWLISDGSGQWWADSDSFTITV